MGSNNIWDIALILSTRTIKTGYAEGCRSAQLKLATSKRVVSELLYLATSKSV